MEIKNKKTLTIGAIIAVAIVAIVLLAVLIPGSGDGGTPPAAYARVSGP